MSYGWLRLVKLQPHLCPNCTASCYIISTRVYKLYSIQNTSRNGNVFRPPLTSLDLNLMCNSVSRNLTTSTTEFNFSDAGCVSATEASTITLTAENVFGRKVVVTVLPPCEFDILCHGLCVKALSMGVVVPVL